MSIFRAHTPVRRIDAPEVKEHGEHRDRLKEDFQNRCGYCNDINTWRFIWYEIDHFVPQKHLKKLKSTDYKNLVYSCRSCNNAKRAKWPTEDETKHNNGQVGFIDPCHVDFNKQFDRLETGRIIPKTDLGNWMFNALKLYKPQHEIIWNIEQLHNLIRELRVVVKEYPDKNDLKDRLIELYNKYDDYIQELFTN